MKYTVRTFENFVSKVGYFNLLVGSVALVFLMLLVVTSSGLRLFFNMPIMGDLELAEISLILALFGGIAYVENLNRHIKVEILTEHFSPKVKEITSICARFFTLVSLCFLTYEIFAESVFLKHSNFTTGLFKIPLWPFLIVTGLFFFLFTLSLLNNLFKDLSRFIKYSENRYYDLKYGILLVFLFFVFPFIIEWADVPRFGPQTTGIIAFLLLFVLIFLEVHIGAAMAMVSFVGLSYLIDLEAGLGNVASVTRSIATNYVWSVIPLFIWMGSIVAESNFSKDLYRLAFSWLSRLPGGLASATISACAGFAAVVGDSVTGVVTMGSIALPEMKKYKYETKIATSCIVVGASLGVLIPPSLGFIVYGIMVEQSIGSLFLAGFLPGVLLVIGFIAYYTIRCAMNPKLGPVGERFSFKEKIVGLKSAGPILVIFFVIIGGIWLGAFTPTEAGAVGCFSALLVGVLMRRLTFKRIYASLINSMATTGSIIFIFVFANCLTQFLAATMLPFALADFISGLTINRYLILIVILASYFLMGCLMNALPALILTLPVIYPTVVKLSFDPIWFGVLLVVMIEIGMLTPPIGMSVFALQSVDKDIPLGTIFKGVIPLWMIMILVVALIIIFPNIALFIPNLMKG